METVFLTVTLGSVALAIGMSVLAWKMLREDRRRMMANAEALEALAAEDAMPESSARLITDTSRRSLDNGMVRVVPAVSSRERVQSSSATPVRTAVPPPAPPRPFVELDDQGRQLGDWVFRDPRESSAAQSRPAAPRAPAPMPTAVPEPRFDAIITPQRSRRWLAFAPAYLLIAVAIGAVYLFRQSADHAGMVLADTWTIRAGESRPLELLSLRHTNDPDGAFTITGLVQNPSNGQTVRKVTAVVYLFDRDGNYFASGRAPLDFVVLQPGDESPFVVHVSNVSHVSRYRVGFRFEDGGVAAHVDRRGQVPGGTTGDGIGEPVDSHRSSDPISELRRSQGMP
jgi:hypothetical protein